MISIIGAGPVGCYLGYLLARNGKQVSIFEEHTKAGEPVQCTGIVSKNLAEIIDIKEEFIANRVYGAEIYAPNNSCLKVRKKEMQAFILDRKKFDKYWLKMAEKAGCNVFLGERFVDFKDGKSIFKGGKTVKTDILIGADGPLSTVAKTTELAVDRGGFLHGIQARIRHDADKDMAKLYLGSVAPGFFAWCVPEGNGICRVGLASKKNAKKYFDRFVKRDNIIEIQAGLIPIYNPNKRIQRKNVYLVGDAAGQVKATTGGGIIMGFIAAKQLAKSIATGRDYAKLCKAKIGKDLWMALMIRKYLNKMNDKDCNRLIRLFAGGNGKARKTLEKYGDMDFPTRFALRLLIAEPRLLRFWKLVLR